MAKRQAAAYRTYIYIQELMLELEQELVLVLGTSLQSVIYDVRFPSFAGSWQFLVSLLEFCGCFLLS